MHDAGNSVKSRFFFLSDVSVTFENDGVAFSVDDSVEDDVASEVAYEGYCARSDVTVCPWTQGNLIPHMKEAWVHAVAFCSDGYGLAFSNKFADFNVH